MSVVVSAPAWEKGARRLALFGLAAGLGTLVGNAWGTSAGPDWAYWGFLQFFLDPRAQIASLSFGLALGLLAGVVHLVRV